MSFHPAQTFVYGEVPSATKMQYIWDNDYALADGSAIANAAIKKRHLDFSDGIFWEEIGRTTLGVAGDTISVTSLPARKYIKGLAILIPTGGTITAEVRFNNDSGTNYGYRNSINGAADGSAGGGTYWSANASGAAEIKYNEFGFMNIANREKIGISHTVQDGGAGGSSVSNKGDTTFKWYNTSAQVNRIDMINSAGTGDFAAGSELVILGHN